MRQGAGFICTIPTAIVEYRAPSVKAQLARLPPSTASACLPFQSSAQWEVSGLARMPEFAGAVPFNSKSPAYFTLEALLSHGTFLWLYVWLGGQA